MAVRDFNSETVRPKAGPALFPAVAYVAALVAFLSITTAGCTRADSTTRAARATSQENTAVVRIAEQHGLAYLPLAIMRIEGLLEKELEEIGSPRVEWIRAGNATMIREAMLSGRLDIGFMGVPPFLIGRDRGTGWRLVTGLSEAPLGLVTLRSGYRSLDDLDARDRIALPQPGSIQHILLAMASERVFGDPRRYDDRLVSMAHPEGLAALLAGRDVAAHFTAPPFLFDALQEPGGTLLLDGRDAFGGRFTFIIGVVAPDWGEDEATGELLQAFLRALDEAVLLARSLQQDDAPRLLREVARFYDLDESTLRRHLSFPGMVYTREVHGVERFIDRMDEYGYLREDRIGEYHSGGGSRDGILE
jgi:NitT/TauT family transport system substrate-binding protein